MGSLRPLEKLPLNERIELYVVCVLAEWSVKLEKSQLMLVDLLSRACPGGHQMGVSGGDVTRGVRQQVIQKYMTAL